jgi:hypothetical protein
MVMTMAQNTGAETAVVTQSVSRGRVLGTSDEGYLIVGIGTPPRIVSCEVVRTPGGSLPGPGAAVLVLLPGMDSEELPVVLGEIGTAAASGADDPAVVSSTPDTLVIEAKHSLTLKVGDGSITIREDGRILIKGRDLVSHAKRVNRIRGGSVQIN